jgi:O-methyltransferase
MFKVFFPKAQRRSSYPRPSPSSTSAVLHLDCDLKEPTRAYPRMARGGLIMIHDYASGHRPGATEAVDDFFADRPERPVIMPDRSGTAIVRAV